MRGTHIHTHSRTQTERHTNTHTHWKPHGSSPIRPHTPPPRTFLLNALNIYSSTFMSAWRNVSVWRNCVSGKICAPTGAVWLREWCKKQGHSTIQTCQPQPRDRKNNILTDVKTLLQQVAAVQVGKESDLFCLCHKSAQALHNNIFRKGKGKMGQNHRADFFNLRAYVTLHRLTIRKPQERNRPLGLKPNTWRPSLHLVGLATTSPKKEIHREILDIISKRREVSQCRLFTLLRINSHFINRVGTSGTHSSWHSDINKQWTLGTEEPRWEHTELGEERPTVALDKILTRKNDYIWKSKRIRKSH